MNFARLTLLGFAALFAPTLVAVPTKTPKAVPVARGFSVLEGVMDANRIAGRKLCPSDLRGLYPKPSANYKNCQTVKLYNCITSRLPQLEQSLQVESV